MVGLCFVALYTTSQIRSYEHLAVQKFGRSLMYVQSKILLALCTFYVKRHQSPDPNQISLTIKNPPHPPGPNPMPSHAAAHCMELTPFAQLLPFDPIDHRTPQRRSLPFTTAATALWTPACRLGRTRRSPRPPPIARSQCPSRKECSDLRDK